MRANGCHWTSIDVIINITIAKQAKLKKTVDAVDNSECNGFAGPLAKR
jgi:hypothetical protein